LICTAMTRYSIIFINLSATMVDFLPTEYDRKLRRDRDKLGHPRRL